MDKKDYRVLDKLIAVSEDGQIFSIMVIQEFILVPKDEGVERVEGVKIYQTSDGKNCKLIDKDTFEIPELSLIAVIV